MVIVLFCRVVAPLDIHLWAVARMLVIRRGWGESMTMAVLAWLVAIPLLGAITGLRTFTPMAVLCWFAYRGDLPVDDTWASWSGKLAAVIIFSVLAVGELVGDKLPRIPDRVASFPLVSESSLAVWWGRLWLRGWTDL